MKNNIQKEGVESSRWQTARQIGQHLSISEGMVKLLRRRGVIPSLTLGPRLIRFDLAAVEEALKRATPKF